MTSDHQTVLHPEPSPFADRNAALAALAWQPALPPGEGHLPLGDGIWLSLEPGRGASFRCDPAEEGGFRLALHDAGRARWASLSFDLPLGGLARGRYVGLRLRARSAKFFSYRPCLRYLPHEGQAVDRFTEDYIVSSGGLREQLSHIPVDHDLLSRCRATEMHLFFQGADFESDILALEALLIL